MTSLPLAKVNQAHQLGEKLGTFKKKDDETVKRYFLLFGMIAVMALATMGIQLLFTWHRHQLLVALCQLRGNLLCSVSLPTALRDLHAPQAALKS